MRKKLGVSIVICGYNSSLIIESTLNYLEKQKVSPKRNWEIIFIDNSSSDDTITKVKSIANKSHFLKKRLRIVKENKIGIVNARIRGFSEAKYEIVGFVDDDNWVSSNWIERVAGIMEDHPDVAVCGGQNKEPKYLNKPFWFEKYKECYALGKQSTKSGDITKKRGFVWGAGMSVRKDAWQEISQKNFKFFLTGRVGNTRSAGDDSELCFALRLAGWKIWYDDKLILVHAINQSRLNWIELRKMFRGFGIGRAGHDPYFFAESNEPKFREHWYAQVVILCWDLLKNLDTLILFKMTSMEGNKEVLKIEHKIGRISFLLREQNKFDIRTNYLRKILAK